MRIVITHFPVFIIWLFDILSLTLCSPWSCHKGIPSKLRPKGTKWKLCLRENQNDVRIKIGNLFNTKDNITGWLAVGFPGDKGKSISDFFKIIKKEKIELKQSEPKKCSLVKQKNPSVVVVRCRSPKGKYLSSKKLKIYYYSGRRNSETFTSDDLLKKHESLSIQLKNQQAPQASKYPKDYAKSMAAIVGVSLLLTTIITITVCCCCKKKETSETRQGKDVSVSFYRDNGEVEGESENTDDDEKVSFIPNNNKNSNV